MNDKFPIESIASNFLPTHFSHKMSRSLKLRLRQVLCLHRILSLTSTLDSCLLGVYAIKSIKSSALIWLRNLTAIETSYWAIVTGERTHTTASRCIIYAQTSEPTSKQTKRCSPAHSRAHRYERNFLNRICLAFDKIERYAQDLLLTMMVVSMCRTLGCSVYFVCLLHTTTFCIAKLTYNVALVTYLHIHRDNKSHEFSGIVTRL